MNPEQLIEKVEGIAVAVVPENLETALPDWYVYLINLKDEPIEGVIVSSKGYGEVEGKNIRTSTLRQFIEKIPAKDYYKVEWIDEKLFGIANEFWISFYQHGKIYDKQYVFVTDSIVEENFTDVPIVGKRGVMIR